MSDFRARAIQLVRDELRAPEPMTLEAWESRLADRLADLAQAEARRIAGRWMPSPTVEGSVIVSSDGRVVERSSWRGPFVVDEDPNAMKLDISFPSGVYRVGGLKITAGPIPALPDGTEWAEVPIFPVEPD